MHRRRLAVRFLALLIVVSGLILLVAPETLLRPTEAYQPFPDLSIHLYRDPDDAAPFAPGNEITYQVYFINQGGYIASDVRVVATLPEPTAYVSSSAPGFVLVQAGPDQVVWVRDRLSVFERGWLSVTLRVDDDAPVGAGAETRTYIQSSNAESDYANNESIVKEYLKPAVPDLVVTQHLWQNSAPIAAGNELVYEIAAQNLGGSEAASVRITGTLPAGCTYSSDNPADSGFATVQTGQTVVWTKAALAPAEDSADSVKLFIQCQIDSDWTPDQWLENLVEISTPDAEYSYDNNLCRWTYKPESDRRYSAAVTSVDDRTMRLLSDAGFDYALYYLDWSEAEPSIDSYDWGNLDTAVWQVWRHNLRLLVRVDRAPEWARGSGTATAPPADPDELGDFLQAAATRWPREPGNPEQAQVYGYVIWNEPNLAAEWGGEQPDPVAYTALLQDAYEGVNTTTPIPASPDAWVISAGLAPTGDDPPHAVDDRTYLQHAYTAGAGSFFDYLGANPMGFASAPDDADPNGFDFTRAEEWRAIMEANDDGDKDIFGTETGWLRDTPLDLGSRYNWMKVSEIDQAHYQARAYHKAHCDWTRSDGTPWMGPLTTWNLDFAAGDYSEADHPYWFGVTDQNRDPLRSYLTLQNAATRGPADLWLEKELVDALDLGQDFRYLIRYTNIGGQAAAGVIMTDTLPLGAEYVGASDGGTPTPTGDQVVWNIGDVDICTYEAVTLTLRLVGLDPGTAHLNNRVEVNTMPGEPYTDDNVATSVDPLPDLLSILKSVTPARVGPGQPLTYTLAFENTGQAIASGVLISDILPVGHMTNISYTRGGAAITPTGDVSYTWQVRDLAPGESGLITITALIGHEVNGTYSLTNRATSSTTSADLYWPNDTSVVSITVDGEAPLPPALASPTNGATTNDNTPTLTLNASPSADAAGYLLDFDGAVQDVGSATQYTTSILAEGTYTWTLAAYDTVGNTGVYTDIWSFTVDTTAPEPPALSSPSDGTFTSTNSLTLTWQSGPSADAAGYLLDFDGSVADAGSTTQHATGVLADGTYTWTAATYDAASNTGAYTGTWSFTVDTTAPNPPALISPVDGAHTTGRTPKLVWQTSPSSGVTGYLLDLDGTVVDLGDVTHHTTGPLAYGTYDWTVAAYNALGRSGAYAAPWSFTTEPHRFYLPLVVKDYVSAPDLVVERILVASDDVQVSVRNQGDATAWGGFWVDVYIAPEPPPTAVNQTWPDLSAEGLVWGVTADLRPGESLTLTVGDGYFADEYSQVTWPLAAGTPVYAQVDSANAGTTYGAVLESHEIAGGAYNNVGGPAYPAAASIRRAADANTADNHAPATGRRLPPRR